MGTQVALVPQAQRSLRFGPPDDAVLTIIVHPKALAAPADRHTQVAWLVDRDPRWLGALGEELLRPMDAPVASAARAQVAPCLGAGERVWDVVWPGELLWPDVRGPLSTIYHGARPWLVVGETRDGQLVAAPLNDISNPKWYTPVARFAEMDFDGNAKDSQVELAHLWTLPASVPSIGWFLDAAIDRVEEALLSYY